jgi:hypothetical protein
MFIKNTKNIIMILLIIRIIINELKGSNTYEDIEIIKKENT